MRVRNGNARMELAKAKLARDERKKFWLEFGWRIGLPRNGGKDGGEKWEGKT